MVLKFLDQLGSGRFRGFSRILGRFLGFQDDFSDFFGKGWIISAEKHFQTIVKSAIERGGRDESKTGVFLPYRWYQSFWINFFQDDFLMTCSRGMFAKPKNKMTSANFLFIFFVPCERATSQLSKTGLKSAGGGREGSWRARFRRPKKKRPDSRGFRPINFFFSHMMLYDVI